MAWYEESRTNAAGQLKAFLDYIITNYGKEGEYGWEIYDSNAGTNIGVYRCKPDDNSSFILVVKDNQADYATIEYWDDWDSETHAGVGNSMTYGCNSSYVLRTRKTTGIFAAAINKRRIVLVMRASGYGYYFGYPKRYDESKDTPLYVGHDSYTGSSAYNYNILGGIFYAGASSSYMEWRLFRDVSGNINRQVVPMIHTSGAEADIPKRDTKTTTGRFIVFEEPVQMWNSPFSLIGVLDGVMCLSKNTQLFKGDTVVVEDDVWLACVATFSSLVRMS